MNGDKIILTIEPGQQTIRLDSCQNGVHSSKLVGLDELADCFFRSQKRPEIHSGLLPPNCLSYSEGEKGWCGIALLFPERYCDFTYHKTTYPHFPLPRLVFRFSLVRGQRVQKVEVGIVAEGRITPESKMYRYPLFQCSGLPDVHRREHFALLRKPSRYFHPALPHPLHAQQ